MSLHPLIADRIRDDGPLTVAAFMDLALYHPTGGYYATAAQRSGRSGDFYTSVDVGPLFGELLSGFVREAMQAWRRLGTDPAPFTLCEAGAGNGRLARDVLDALEIDAPDCHANVSVALVERSAAARAGQAATLGRHAPRLAWSADGLPSRVDGLILANELLDAMPVHRVAMTRRGLRELYVDLDRDGLVLREGALSTPRLAAYFDEIGVALARGAVADVSLAAIDWLRTAAGALGRGWIVLIDYGHEAAQLYAGPHTDGTLRSYRRHLVDGATRGRDASPPWLSDPGSRDLTAHVDFTALQRTARAEGLEVLGFVDQTRFLAGLGLAGRLAGATGTSLADVKRRLAAQALVSPEGLGGSHRVLVLGRDAPEALGFGL